MTGPLWSRRQFLFAAAVAPSEWRRLRDPATEFEVTRLTDPANPAWLPRQPLRSVSGRTNTLLYVSNRGGSTQAWRMDLKTGENRQVTEASALVRDTVAMLPDDRTVLYFDGRALVVSDKRLRTVYTAEGSWRPERVLDISTDGSLAAVSESNGSRHRLHIIGLKTRVAPVLFEAPDIVQYAAFRPRSRALVYGHSGSLDLADAEGGPRKRLPVRGDVRAAIWSADGKLLHYVTREPERGRVELREVVIDTAEERAIATTTQFASFARNSDSSVFAGVSGTKASPYILLLTRAGRRELTISEHRASDAAAVSVTFSPNNQRLYYTTDREGASAVYMMALERFVEEAAEEER